MHPQNMYQKLDAFRLPWGTLQVVAGGKSPIDVSNWFQIDSLEEAERFLQSYGFNYQDPIQQAELYGHFQEAVSFIRRYFLFPENPNGIKDDIPQNILALGDFRYLFMLASKPNHDTADIWREFVSDPWSQEAEHLHNWACALLKVLHTIAHIDKDIRSGYFTEVQKQILDRFYKHLYRDSKDQLYIKYKDEKVPLVAFESKPKKSRDSIILKLLHKHENVAEDIFDRIGIRFITKTRLDCLRVIQFLLENHVVMPANVKPSKTKNNLINLMQCKEKFSELESLILNGKRRPKDLFKAFDEFIGDSPKNESPFNEYSLEKYKAIQFTCRQLVTYQNPLFQDFQDLRKTIRDREATKDAEKEKLDPAIKRISTILNRINTSEMRREIRFFYPFEVQIVDQASHEVNMLGEGSHSEYKASQIKAAQKRVMGPLMVKKKSK